jgi:hypothetical protein
MAEIVFILEPDKGRVTVESSQATTRLAKEIERDLGQAVALNCARPAESFQTNKEKKTSASDNELQSNGYSMAEVERLVKSLFYNTLFLFSTTY